MAKAKFIIRKTDGGNFVFALRSANGENVGVGGEPYSSKKACEGGVASVIRNSAVAPVEDRTLKNFEAQKNPKFVIYYDKANEFRFRLCASNGEPVLASQGYSTKAACKNGVDSVRKNSPVAEIVFEEPAPAGERKGAKAPVSAKAPKAETKAPKADAKTAKADAKAQKAEAKAEKADAKAKKKSEKSGK